MYDRSELSYIKNVKNSIIVYGEDSIYMKKRFFNGRLRKGSFTGSNNLSLMKKYYIHKTIELFLSTILLYLYTLFQNKGGMFMNCILIKQLHGKMT